MRTIRRYANRKLYDTKESHYVTLAQVVHIPDDLGSDSGALGQGIGAKRRVHFGYGAKRRGEGMLGLG